MSESNKKPTNWSPKYADMRKVAAAMTGVVAGMRARAEAAAIADDRRNRGEDVPDDDELEPYVVCGGNGECFVSFRPIWIPRIWLTADEARDFAGKLARMADNADSVARLTTE